MTLEYRLFHRCRSRQIFGGAKEFRPNFPQACPQSFCAPNIPWSEIATGRAQKSLQFMSSGGFSEEKKVKFRRLSFRLIWKCRNICARIFWDFRWIFDKSKLLEVRLHPQLLHHCSFRYYILRNHPHSVNCDKHMLHLSLNLCDICLTFWFYGQVNFYPTSAQNFAKAIYVLRSFN